MLPGSQVTVIMDPAVSDVVDKEPLVGAVRAGQSAI